MFRIFSDAARDITGITAPASSSPLIQTWINVGAFAITLKANSGSSSAANQISAPADIVLTALGGAVTLWYDSTSTVWRRTH